MKKNGGLRSASLHGSPRSRNRAIRSIAHRLVFSAVPVHKSGNTTAANVAHSLATGRAPRLLILVFSRQRQAHRKHRQLPVNLRRRSCTTIPFILLPHLFTATPACVVPATYFLPSWPKDTEVNDQNIPFPRDTCRPFSVQKSSSALFRSEVLALRTFTDHEVGTDCRHISNYHCQWRVDET